jgi:hypothetical protein
MRKENDRKKEGRKKQRIEKMSKGRENQRHREVNEGSKKRRRKCEMPSCH